MSIPSPLQQCGISHIPRLGIYYIIPNAVYYSNLSGGYNPVWRFRINTRRITTLVPSKLWTSMLIFTKSPRLCIIKAPSKSACYSLWYFFNVAYLNHLCFSAAYVVGAPQYSQYKSSSAYILCAHKEVFLSEHTFGAFSSSNPHLVQ